jgi:glucokinase
MTNDQIVIGTDIGGSHITCMAVNPGLKEIIHEICIRKTVDSQGPAEEILSTWAGALKECLASFPLSHVGGIGFAMPGPFDYPKGLALFSGVKKYDSLYNINIRDEMRRRLSLPETIPVRFMNDATCFAIGEAWLGKASACRRTMAITLGTGFGSAFLDNGIPVESGDEVPAYGCVYHLPYGDSIADDYFSSRWFEKSYVSRFKRPSPGVKVMTDQAGTMPAVMEIFTDFGERLGTFLSPWLRRFHAGCITIGGNIARSYDLFGPAFVAALKRENCISEVHLSTLGEHAAIVGSARLADDIFYSKLPFISNK